MAGDLAAAGPDTGFAARIDEALTTTNWSDVHLT